MRKIERLSAELAVLQRMVFGRSWERARPQDLAPDGDGGGGPGRDRAGGGKGRPRGPGARAGRRDYSHLPRFEVTWDFEGGGYCCPQCRGAVHPAG
jgi:transposase